MNFPSPFRSLHSSLFIAFHCLLSPFITFHRRPISLSTHSLLSRFVLASPRFVLASPRFVLASPRFILTSPPSLAMPPSFTHHCLRSFVLLPFFYSLCFTPSIVFTLSHCFTSFVLFLPPLLYSLHCFTPLCFAHSIVLHRFALLSTIVYPPFALLSPIVYTPFALFTPIVLHPFFYSPATSANPDTAKGNVFLIFQRNFAKSP